ncbi:MAG: hypothetical protein J07AB43_05140 [Candidatus Nanosalina sp. J07AB43]|nr:MAG: hypothetical protein J07AB43_05140 [Candidatus Nanosalina sp. J07AB43]
MSKISQTAEQLSEFLDLVKQDRQNIERVIQEIKEKNLDAEFIIHPKSESVEDSSKNTGYNPEEIVKTLIFVAENPVAVMCPGHTSVSEQKLEKITGHEARMATPEEVKEHTGYQIGGVSPFDLDIKTYMEETILAKQKVKPAAGSKVTGVSIKPEDLKKASEAETVDVSRK